MRPKAFPERTLVMSKKITTATPPTGYNKEQGWYRNTSICVDLKTILRSDRTMKSEKEYPGVLRRDVECEEFHYSEHYTFVETLPQGAEKRNPHVFMGEYITITRKDDGSLRPNFKALQISDGFPVDSFALEVANEIRQALTGLIGKSK